MLDSLTATFLKLRKVAIALPRFAVLCRGEHFPEFAKNHWGKVPNFWDLGKSLMKFNSARVVAIWDGEMLTTWRNIFLYLKRNSTQFQRIYSHVEGKLNANYP